MIHTFYEKNKKIIHQGGQILSIIFPRPETGQPRAFLELLCGRWQQKMKILRGSLVMEIISAEG